MLTTETKVWINEYCDIHVRNHKLNIRSITNNMKGVRHAKDSIEYAELKALLHEHIGAVRQLEALKFSII